MNEKLYYIVGIDFPVPDPEALRDTILRAVQDQTFNSIRDMRIEDKSHIDVSGPHDGVDMEGGFHVGIGE